VQGDAIVIKLGLLVGSCIVVTLNERLDYFGSTVNMAARLQGQSEGGDIVLSRAVAQDPAVKPLLAGVPAREESVLLKGFAEPVCFVRVQATQIPLSR
jgi:class 3 adenylate cyclase